MDCRGFVALGSIPQAIAYVVTPAVVARRGAHHGWSCGRPSRANQVGLIPIGAGVALIEWALASHCQQAPTHWRLTITPDYLVRRGAYARSRNPLYVGGALVLSGWVVFFGSARLAVLAVTWLGLIATVVVPLEEHLLCRKFGDTYEAYRGEVQRWIAVRGKRPQA
jgi:protein-S-isoprenylcysteine O-methyltransferase Ste14